MASWKAQKRTSEFGGNDENSSSSWASALTAAPGVHADLGADLIGIDPDEGVGLPVEFEVPIGHADHTRCRRRVGGSGRRAHGLSAGVVVVTTFVGSRVFDAMVVVVVVTCVVVVVRCVVVVVRCVVVVVTCVVVVEAASALAMGELLMVNHGPWGVSPPAGATMATPASSNSDNRPTWTRTGTLDRPVRLAPRPMPYMSTRPLRALSRRSRAGSCGERVVRGL